MRIRTSRRVSALRLTAGTNQPEHTLETLEQRALLAADLVAAELTVPAQTVSPGGQINVALREANIGDTDAGPYRTQIRLSTDQFLGNFDDIVIGTLIRASGLNAGDSLTDDLSFTIPDDVVPGNYFVGFRADSLGAVSEFNELNNTLVTASARITVSAPAGAADIDVIGRNNRRINSGDTRPAFLDGTAFGKRNVNNQFRDRTFTIFNRGDADLDLNAITLTGAGAGQFQILTQPGAVLAPGASADLVIRFDPSVRGVHRAAVNINSSDADESPYTFSIVGTGRGIAQAGPPDISISALAPIADGDRTASTADGTNFGVTTVGQFLDREFTITNNGAGTLVLSNPFISLGGRNPFRFTVIDTPDNTLAPGESTTFTIRFNASRPGTAKAFITVFSNDPDSGIYDFQIRARGMPPTPNN